MNNQSVLAAAPDHIADASKMVAPAGQGVGSGPLPAPDVTQLVEALEQCITSMLDSGYRANALVIRAARAALAAYRKQPEGEA